MSAMGISIRLIFLAHQLVSGFIFFLTLACARDVTRSTRPTQLRHDADSLVSLQLASNFDIRVFGLVEGALYRVHILVEDVSRLSPEDLITVFEDDRVNFVKGDAIEAVRWAQCHRGRPRAEVVRLSVTVFDTFPSLAGNIDDVVAFKHWNKDLHLATACSAPSHVSVSDCLSDTAAIEQLYSWDFSVFGSQREGTSKKPSLQEWVQVSLSLFLRTCASDKCIHTYERDLRPSMLAFFPWKQVPLVVVADDPEEHGISEQMHQERRAGLRYSARPPFATVKWAMTNTSTLASTLSLQQEVRLPYALVLFCCCCHVAAWQPSITYHVAFTCPNRCHNSGIAQCTTRRLPLRPTTSSTRISTATRSTWGSWIVTRCS